MALGRHGNCRTWASVLGWLWLGLASTAGAVVLDGQVTRSDSGEPVDGAVVLVRGSGLYVQTNAEGRYALPGIPAGVYGVSCAAAGLVGVSTAALDVTQDASRDFALEPPAGSGSVSGTVRCDGSGCAGTLIQALQEGRVRARSLSGPGGAYALVGLEPGAYDLRAVRLGHQIVEHGGVTVSADAPAVVDLALASVPADRSISGYVALSDNPLDRSGSQVVRYGSEPPPTATTAASGAYQLTQVPTGLLSLAARRSGYDGQQRIDVLVDGDRRLDFVLHHPGEEPVEPSYRVAGTVRLADPEGGEPQAAAGTRVSLWQPDAPQPAHTTTTTGAEGAFAFTGVPAGRWQLGAAREGWLSARTDPFTLEADSDQELVLEFDSDYDWGPGADAGGLGCGCAGRDGPAGSGLTPGALGLLLALGLLRRRWP